MPSFLGKYSTAASDRENKIIRAINSVINQTFQDWELIVVADGCEKTFDIVSRVYADNDKVSCYLIKKSLLFSGIPRTCGIDQASGEFIVYLDIDDYYGANHLQKINDNLKEFDWVWFNDYRWKGKWVENPCSITTIGRNGTSNICHKKSLGEKWTAVGYSHDYHFNRKLLKHTNYTKIETPEYFVCHVPGIYDV